MRHILLIFLIISSNAYGDIDYPKKSFVVLLDAGHGASDQGNISQDGTFEKDITLRLMILISEKITQTDNIEIQYTRTDDSEVNLRSRNELSNAVDLMISLHTNSSENPIIRGAEIHIPSQGQFVEYSSGFAEILKSKISHSAIPFRKVSNGNFYILNHARCPSILISMGMMSNEDDLTFMTSPEYLSELAEHIAQSVKQFAKTSLKQ